jgi:hypothetical protein
MGDVLAKANGSSTTAIHLSKITLERYHPPSHIKKKRRNREKAVGRMNHTGRANNTAQAAIKSR